jgi:MYXO-CTERM domain-containing protein
VVGLVAVVAASADPGGADTRPILVPQLGHADEVTAATFSPDGGLVATFGGSEVCLWHARTGSLVRRLPGSSAVFAPDGTRVATTGDDGVTVWDIETGEPLLRFEGDIARVAYAPDGARLVIASDSSRRRPEASARRRLADAVVVRDAQTGEVISTLEGSTAPVIVEDRVVALEFSPDGERVLVARDARYGVANAGVWDAASGALAFYVEGFSEGASDAAFSPDGTRIAVVSFDAFHARSGTMRGALFDAETGGLVHALALSGRHALRGQPGVVGGAEDAAFSANGSRLLVAGSDGFSVFDAETGSAVFRVTTGSSAAVLSPDGERVATSLGVWSVATGVRMHALQEERGFRPITSFSPNGETLLTEGAQGGESLADAGRLTLWSVQDGRPLRYLAPAAAAVHTAGFTPGGERLVTVSADHTASVWDLAAGSRPLHLRGHSTGDVRASADHARVVVADGGGTQDFWDPTADSSAFSLRARRPVEEAVDEVGLLSLSPDETTIAIVSYDRVTVRDARTGVQIHELDVSDDPDRSPERAAFSPDGSVLAVGSGRGVGLFDVRTGEEGLRIGVEEAADSQGRGGLGEVAFSADGASLLVAYGGEPRLYEVDGGRTLRGFRRGASDGLISPRGDRILLWEEGSRAFLYEVERRFGDPLEQVGRDVTSAAFSPSGDRVVIAHEDLTATVVDAASGEDLHRLFGHRAPISSAEFSADGTRIVTAAADATTRLWDADTGAHLATIISFTNGTWAVVDADGRFDTEDVGTLTGAVWVRPFDPDRPVSITSFARDYFTPGLLADVWHGRALPTVPDVADVSVLTPALSLTAETVGHALRVVATVCAREQEMRVSGGLERQRSEAHDLRLFLDERLVSWQDGVVAEAGCTTHAAKVAPPAGPATVRISAHAFNVDGVKSDTVVLQVDNPRRDLVGTRRAVLVHVGVDDYAGKGLAPLSWASADATAMAHSLAGVPADSVHQVVLGTSGHARPTRDNLRAVLEAIGGMAPPPPWAPDLVRSGPDDVVIVSFSGHGYAPEGGAFHLMLDDTDRTDTGGIEGALPHAVSEHELAEWLRPVTAAELVLVVDACQSAASVEGEGFKPGPLGSKGFGQLAYDKGMLVLAASQSDAVALESADLKHGLLTWALVVEGLDGGHAEKDGTAGITVREWLEYAEARVPELAAMVARGDSPNGARAVRRSADGWRSAPLVASGSETSPSTAQQPRLFAFKRAGGALLVGPEAEPGGCGCSSAAHRAGWVLLLGLAAIRRRRHRRSPCR